MKHLGVRKPKSMIFSLWWNPKYPTNLLAHKSRPKNPLRHRNQRVELYRLGYTPLESAVNTWGCSLVRQIDGAKRHLENKQNQKKEDR